MKTLIWLLPSLFLVPAHAADITVHVTGFEDDSGYLRCTLFSKSREEYFPTKSSQADFLTDTRISGRHAVATIRNVPAGTYSLFVYHDSNGNGAMDHKWYGPPAEAFAYYRSFEVKMLPPGFDEVSFEVDRADLTLEIPLQRY